jgi:alpha-N-arabinofuranosidase
MNHAMLEPIFKDEPELIQSTNQTGIPISWQALNKAAGNRYELHVGHAANELYGRWQVGFPTSTRSVPAHSTSVRRSSR